MSRFVIVLAPSSDAPESTWTEHTIEANSQKDAEIEACYRARNNGLHLRDVRVAAEKKPAKKVN